MDTAMSGSHDRRRWGDNAAHRKREGDGVCDRERGGLHEDSAEARCQKKETQDEEDVIQAERDDMSESQSEVLRNDGSDRSRIPQRHRIRELAGVEPLRQLTIRVVVV